MSQASAPRHLALVVPGSLHTLTGGYVYDRRQVDGLRQRGWRVDVHELPDEFPFPSDAARAAARAVLASITDGTLVLVDGLAGGVLADELAREAGRLRMVALVHHPLALETGLELSVARELEASERRALACMRAVVVTSTRTAATLAAWGHRPIVVVPGTDPAPQASGSGSSRLEMLCVATLTPRKGHELLFRALAGVPSRSWHLTCVGSLQRDVRTTERLQRVLADLRLEPAITLHGEAHGPVLEALYGRADVFVLPTLYEGYGMVVAEALARGLPVVGTNTGAIADLVGDDAGIVVEPGDEAALARAVSALLCDRERLQRAAAGARARRASLPSWETSAEQLEAALLEVG